MIAATGRVLAVGLVVGLNPSILASWILAGRMQGMGAGDALIFVLVPGVLILVTVLAAVVPARSATQVAPVEARRHV